MNCDPIKYDILVAKPDLTVAAIKENSGKRAKFNKGLYFRSRMLAKSSSRTVDTITPLRYLHPFFKLRAFYPHRNMLGLKFQLKPDSCILILDNGEGATEKFKLTVKECWLELRYGVFEDQVRSMWLEKINLLGLRRNVQTFKTVQLPIPKGSLNWRFNSLFNFSVCPQSLMLYFVLENTAKGDYKNNRYVYKHFNLDSLKIYKSGIPLLINPLYNNMKLSSKYGYFHYHFYQNMQQLFGPSAADVTMDSFYKDAYVFCFNLAQNPRYGTDYGVTRDPAERKLSYLEGANLDMDVVFSVALPENVIACFTGVYDLWISMDANGAPIE